MEIHALSGFVSPVGERGGLEVRAGIPCWAAVPLPFALFSRHSSLFFAKLYGAFKSSFIIADFSLSVEKTENLYLEEKARRPLNMI